MNSRQAYSSIRRTLGPPIVASGFQNRAGGIPTWVLDLKDLRGVGVRASVLRDVLPDGRDLPLQFKIELASGPISNIFDFAWSTGTIWGTGELFSIEQRALVTDYYWTVLSGLESSSHLPAAAFSSVLSQNAGALSINFDDFWMPAPDESCIEAWCEMSLPALLARIAKIS